MNVPKGVFELNFVEDLTQPISTIPNSVDSLENHFEPVDLEIDPTRNDSQSYSVMLKLEEILNVEENKIFKTAVDDIDNYARVRKSKVIGKETLLQYLSRETDPTKAKNSLQEILDEIKDLRPDDMYIQSLYQQLTNSVQSGTVQDLINKGAGKDDASYELRNKFYLELKKSGADTKKFWEYVQLNENAYFIKNMDAVFGQLKRISEKESMLRK